jgi:hypothetical protein
MSMLLQQLDTGLKATDHKAGSAGCRVLLGANQALLLVLVLVIIPTISGVA